MATLVELPTEILRIICGHLYEQQERKALAALCLGNRRLRDITQQVLYKAVISVKLLEVNKPAHVKVEELKRFLGYTEIISIDIEPTQDQRDRAHMCKAFAELARKFPTNNRVRVLTFTYTSCLYKEMRDDLNELLGRLTNLRRVLLPPGDSLSQLRAKLGFNPNSTPKLEAGAYLVQKESDGSPDDLDLALSDGTDARTASALLKHKSDFTSIYLVGNGQRRQLSTIFQSLAIPNTLTTSFLSCKEMRVGEVGPIYPIPTLGVDFWDCKETRSVFRYVIANGLPLKKLHFAEVMLPAEDCIKNATTLLDVVKLSKEIEGLSIQATRMKQGMEGSTLVSQLGAELRYLLLQCGSEDVLTTPLLKQLLENCPNLAGLGMTWDKAGDVFAKRNAANFSKEFKKLGHVLSSGKLRHFGLRVKPPQTPESKKLFNKSEEEAYQRAAKRIVRAFASQGCNLITVAISMRKHEYSENSIAIPMAQVFLVTELRGDGMPAEHLTDEDQEIIRAIGGNAPGSIGYHTMTIGRPIQDLRPREKRACIVA